MKLALIGFGAMGQLVQSEAQKKKDEVGSILSSKDDALTSDELINRLRGHDAAIDFSVANVVLKNAEACALAGVPLVEGTTGWRNVEEVKRIVNEHHGAMVYGANFSIGMNVFYRIVANASDYIAAVDQYEPFIEEAHHSRKRDAPSGTALRLREFMAEKLSRDIPVSSTRAGHIPGTHRVGFDSEADQILLTHTARSRQGFAAGGLVAAHWIQGRKGVFEFTDVMAEILGS